MTVLFCVLCVSASASTVRGDLSERFPPKETIEFEGAKYQRKDGIQTILLLGIDNTSSRAPEHKASHDYRHGGQSDFMLLVVIDEKDQKVTPVQIDRDTMTDIVILDILGHEYGTNYLQICLSHGFGDGGAQSCELACRAVEGLMGLDEIDYYISMDIDAIPTLNDAIGGVTVTVPEDMTFLDPALYLGNTLTIHGQQAMYFVRSRYGIGDQTNKSRMSRQRTYMKAFADIIQSRVQADANYIGTLFDTMQPLLTTDMRRGAMINIAWAAKDYERVPTVAPEGEHMIGWDGFIEFHPDERALEALKISLFYEPAKAGA